MPRIELITPVEVDSLWPYDSTHDNIPLRNLALRDELINLAVDQAEDILEASKGSTGSLANRLDQSIDDDGSLISEAVDSSLHLIGAHTDGEYDGIEYVRMLAEERTKLSTIADDATSISISVETISNIVVIDAGSANFIESDTIAWSFTSPNIFEPTLKFSTETIHQHYYDLVPVHDDLMTPDYENYKTTSTPTPFIEGSLRIYVNGIKLSENDEVYVYVKSDGPSGDWELLSYIPDAEAGTFALSRAIDEDDLIVIDFDTSPL